MLRHPIGPIAAPAGLAAASSPQRAQALHSAPGVPQTGRARPRRLVVPHPSWTGKPGRRRSTANAARSFAAAPAAAATTEYDSRSLARGRAARPRANLRGSRRALRDPASSIAAVLRAPRIDRRPQAALSGAVPTYAVAEPCLSRTADGAPASGGQSRLHGFELTETSSNVGAKPGKAESRSQHTGDAASRSRIRTLVACIRHNQFLIEETIILLIIIVF
jgi:hypothetical protein